MTTNTTSDPDVRVLPESGRNVSGLTEAEARSRLDAGLGNADPSRKVHSWDVVRRNVVTSFNVVLAALITALLIVGEVRDGLFVGAPRQAVADRGRHPSPLFTLFSSSSRKPV